MPAKRKIRVSYGGRTLGIYRWQHPDGRKLWRFITRDEDGRRVYHTHETQAAAEGAAERHLRKADTFDEEWSTLPADRREWLGEVNRAAGSDAGTQRAILAFIRARSSSAEIGACVERFIAFKKVSAGEVTPHLRTVQLALEEMARFFRGKAVADIHGPDLLKWWQSRGLDLSAKRQKDIRAALVTFWEWARLEGVAGTESITPAKRLPTPKLGDHDRQLVTVQQLKDLLEHVASEWRAWVVLGAFAGLRPEEISPGPSKIAGKRGLLCEEIDWQFSVIRLPARVAKGGKRPRNIPLNEACKAGLEWAGITSSSTGPVCSRNPSHWKELARLGKQVFGGDWPKDALRHTYGSSRNAILRNLPQVAEEMGNSVAMLHKHYHNPQTLEEGQAWFAVRPTSANCGTVADRDAQSIGNQ